MENANPPPTSNRPVLPVALRAQAVQELHELQRISAFVDSHLESIERFLNNFANQPNETNMNDLESDDSETLCLRERIKELELRTQGRNNFKEELFKDMFPTEEELAYHKELLGLVRFAHRDDEVVFKLPQRTKELDIVSPLEKDKFEAFLWKA
ncbi:hypothetical protein Tco_1413873 [Tanacetum coccineum]